jgi:ribonuclease-3
VSGGDRLTSNERLEFLGDAILDLVVAHELFRQFPRKSEGELTELKSLLVSRPTLERTAREIGLGGALLLSANEEATGGRTRPSILADAFEALLGAVYLDGGFEAVRRIVIEHLIRELPAVSRDPDLGNWKSRLLEHVQKEKTGRLIYQTTDERGPDHDKTFVVQVMLDQRVLGEGRGDSKKQAQQVAARAALEALGIVDENGRSVGLDEGEERS